jgi:RHS repeat-associated protein
MEYDIYGKRKIDGGESSIPFRQAGQYEDIETGLYYSRMRYYSAETGTFISKDPIGLEGGMQLYNYVHDSNFWIDPLGLAIIKGDGITGGRSKRIRFSQLFDDIKSGKTKGKEYLDRQLSQRSKSGTTFREFDYDPAPTPSQRLNGADRGKRRVVMGSDGKAYYTNDHYRNFQKIKRPKYK